MGSERKGGLANRREGVIKCVIKGKSLDSEGDAVRGGTERRIVREEDYRAGSGVGAGNDRGKASENSTESE